jgi:hypothetical protein
MAAMPILAALAFLAALKGQEFLLHSSSLAVGWRAFERAGIDFIDENGGGPGASLRRFVIEN